MNNIKILGIDIAKEIFQLHGVNQSGELVMKKKINRHKLLEYITLHVLQDTRIVMEACGGAHYWARVFQRAGYQVELISPQFVKPFVKTNKNDEHDAEGITIAAQQPSMRYVPIKQVEQQDIQSIHRIRERLIGNRTALVNQIRGLLQEYGVVVARGVTQITRALPRVIDETHNELSQRAREEFQALYEELKALEKRIKSYDQKIKVIFKQNVVCQKIGQVEGIGPITATMLLVHLSNPSLFKNGRHFAAYLGLVPKQYSSGGKQRLLGISKRGDCYLRGLLIHGGRAVLKTLGQKKDRRSRWARELKERRGYNRTAVAIANKNARIAWTLVANDADYKQAA